MGDETDDDRLRREALARRLAGAVAVDRPPSSISAHRREKVRLNMIAYRKRLADKREAEAAELARLRALAGETK